MSHVSRAARLAMGALLLGTSCSAHQRVQPVLDPPALTAEGSRTATNPPAAVPIETGAPASEAPTPAPPSGPTPEAPPAPGTPPAPSPTDGRPFDKLMEVVIEMAKLRLLQGATNGDAICDAMKESNRRLEALTREWEGFRQTRSNELARIEKALESLAAFQTAESNELATIKDFLTKTPPPPRAGLTDPKLWQIFCLALFIFLAFMQTPRLIEALAEYRRRPPTGSER